MNTTKGGNNQNSNSSTGEQIKDFFINMGLLTKIIIILNILVYIFQSFVTINQFEYIICLKPILEGQFYRIVTATFSHADFKHIFFNMVTMMWFSPPLEKHHGLSNYLIINLLLIIGQHFVAMTIMF